ncbi:hypothetical protein D1872_283960 [compost metagenome]
MGGIRREQAVEPLGNPVDQRPDDGHICQDRESESQQTVAQKPGSPFSVIGRRRHISRNKKEQSHKKGLVDRREQRQDRFGHPVISRVDIIPVAGPAICNRGVVKDDQDRHKRFQPIQINDTFSAMHHCSPHFANA